MFVASPLTHFYTRTYIEIKGICKSHFIIILQFLKRIFNWFLIATLVTHLNCLNVFNIQNTKYLSPYVALDDRSQNELCVCVCVCVCVLCVCVCISTKTYVLGID